MKARVILTGDIIDVSPKYVQNSAGGLYACGDKVYYGDQLDFVDTDDSGIDWGQRRYEIAKEAMQGILSNQNQVNFALSQADYRGGAHSSPIAFAQYAVACADALIKELKGE